MRVAIIALAAITLAGNTAAAADDDDSPSPFDTYSSAVFLHTALHGPYGFLGFEAEQAVLPLWTLSGGVGFGEASSLQGAAMTHLRFGGNRARVEIGAGLSYGDEVWKELCGDEPCTKAIGSAVRANAEVGGAHRWPNGFTMKYFVGYSRVAEGSLSCQSVNNPGGCATKLQNDGLATMYTGFAVGASF